jgi:hypothetical protein
MAWLTLLLCVIFTAWWIRSLYADDQLVYVWTSESPAIYGNFAIGANCGTVELFYIKQQSPSLIGMIQDQRRQKKTGLLYLKSIILPTGQQSRLWSFRRETSTTNGYSEKAGWLDIRLWLLTTPMAVACAVFSWIAIRYRLQSMRFAAGLCAVCGYDLRMSPDRCPECGVIAAPAIPSS